MCSPDLDQMMRLLEISPLTTSVNAIPWQDYIGKLLGIYLSQSWFEMAWSWFEQWLEADSSQLGAGSLETGLELVDLILVFFQVE